MTADPTPHGVAKYTFGPFILDARTRTLTRAGALVPLAPKAVETLLVLVERPGEIVGRDELIERIWPDAFVEPNNLAQQISMIRVALDDRSSAPRYVETISRRGYRFIGSLSAIERRPERGVPGSGRPDIPAIAYARSARPRARTSAARPSR